MYTLWQDERRAYVTGAAGNLALVDYIEVKGETQLEAFDATCVRHEEGVLLRAGNDVTVDDSPVDGEIYVPRLRPDGTPLIRRGNYTADVFSLDGTDYEIRVYSTESEKLADFERIEYYDYNPEMVFPATFKEYETTDSVPWDFTRSTDTGHSKKVPGVAVVEIEGKTYELLAFLDGQALVLTFADETTGKESYPPGRFLRLDSPSDGEQWVVDFNRSFIPPCGFSNFYSCPLPPAQNRIAAPIRAGEKIAHWKSEDD